MQAESLVLAGFGTGVPILSLVHPFGSQGNTSVDASDSIPLCDLGLGTPRNDWCLVFRFPMFGPPWKTVLRKSTSKQMSFSTTAASEHVAKSITGSLRCSCYRRPLRLLMHRRTCHGAQQRWGHKNGTLWSRFEIIWFSVETRSDLEFPHCKKPYIIWYDG